MYDVIRKVVTDISAKGGDVIHTALIVIGFGAIAGYFLLRQREAEINPVKIIGRITLMALGLMTLIGLSMLSSLATFIVENGMLLPKNYPTLMVASVLSVAAGIAAIIIFIAISDLIFIKRRRKTKRNYLILLVVGGLYLFQTFIGTDNSQNGDFPTSLLSTFTFVLTVFAMIQNSFRLSWIVYLTRREKVYGMLFSLFGMIFFIMLTIFTYGQSDLLHQSLLYYHQSLLAFVSTVFLFAAIYLGMNFASTLFQLPTAEAFDRKKAEITSLQNMSRLITQVLDYDELVATTINLSLDVCEAHAAWLEIIPHVRIARSHFDGDRIIESVDTDRMTVVASKNIDRYAVPDLRRSSGEPLQSLVFESKKPLIIHDFVSDRRVHHLKAHRKNIGSLAMVPLSSHAGIFGILSVIKKIPFGFDRDILNALFAFTDLVTIALENNKLIEQSIEKERLEQELMVAQTMQQKLLPQRLPSAPEFEVSAISLPAYEVGGDYYDVVQLEKKKIGFVVGDVSGKGVSAALYMAQVKGIFQSLCMQSPTAKDLLIKTNAALYGSMERKSFVSLLYAIIDIDHETFSYSRAGHCPVLYFRNSSTSYLRPNGMGLGLDNTGRFAESIEEDKIHLKSGDLLLLFTDGITEAKNASDDEFGYSRLSDVVKQWSHESCTTLMHEIIKAVKTFTGGGAADDDITLLALRWKGKNESQPAPNEKEELHIIAT